MKISLLFLTTVLVLFFINCLVNASDSIDLSTESIKTLLEKKIAYSSSLTSLNSRLRELQEEATLKQHEIYMIQLANNSLTIIEKSGAEIQLSKAAKRLNAINNLINNVQAKIKTSDLAISKVDEVITNKLGITTNINRFAILSSTGGDGLLMVKDNDSIYGIGNNKYGNLGCGHRNTPMTSPCQVIDVLGLLKGKTIWQMKSQEATIILTTDNTLIAFGSAYGIGRVDHSATPVLIDNSLFVGKQIKQLEVGYTGGMILTTDGNVYAWGKNAYGDLCIPLTGPIGSGSNYRLSPVLLSPIKKVKKIFYQAFTSVFLMEDGDVYYCGRAPNAVSSFGTYTQLNVSNIVNSNFGDSIEDIVISNTGYLFRTKLGNLYSIGTNSYGTLGLGDTVDRTVQPTLINYFKQTNTVITKVCAGFAHIIALSKEGKVYQWGTGQNYEIQNAFPMSVTPIRFIGNEIENYKIVDIVCAGATNLAISDSGVVFGWGLSYLFGTGSSISAVPTKLILP